MKESKYVIAMPGTGAEIGALGSRVRVRVPAEATGGAFSVVELEMAPGFRSPGLQRHRHVDWNGLVLEGRLVVVLDGEPREVPAGGLVYVPRGVAFQLQNPDGDRPARILFTYTPGGFERYFQDLVDALGAFGRPPAPEDLAAVVPTLLARYELEMVDV